MGCKPFPTILYYVGLLFIYIITCKGSNGMKNIFDLPYWQQYDINEDKVLEYLEYINGIKNISDRSEDYTERHHIVPRCVDSSLSKEKDNIIVVSGREHFIAHKMLADCFNGELSSRLNYALIMMCGSVHNENYYISAEEYEYIRKEISRIQTGKVIPNDVRLKMSESHKGKKFTDEHKKNLGKWQVGRKLSFETRKKISKTKQERKTMVGENNPMYGTKRPDYVLDIMSEKAKDTKWVNNGIEQKQVKENELDHYLANGYVFGMLKKKPSPNMKFNKGRKKINNGIEEKSVFIDELEYYFSIGYKLGRLPPSNETKQKISNTLKNRNAGELNVNYGKCWINNGVERKLVLQTDLETYLSNGWKIGYKI